MSLLRHFLTQTAEICGIARNNANAIASNDHVSENKVQFGEAVSLIKTLRTKALDEWNLGILPNWADYRGACTTRLLTPRGVGNTSNALLHDMAVAMSALWDLMPSNIAVLADDIYSVFDSWAETATKMQTRIDNINDYVTRGVDLFANHLVALTKAEAQTITGDNSNDATVDSAWQSATSPNGDPVNDIAPAREIFMKHKIETNLTIPGIVLIGSNHVRNLTGNVADAKFHQNYDQFVQDTLR